ncbi:HNH endonuclease [Streptomyces sp. NPDC001774]
MAIGRSGRPWRRFVAQCRRELPPICHLCTNPIDLTLPVNHAMSWTIDHVLPLNQYPHLAEDISNARPAHRTCNSRKGTKEAIDKPKTSRKWK